MSENNLLSAPRRAVHVNTTVGSFAIGQAFMPWTLDQLETGFQQKSMDDLAKEAPERICGFLFDRGGVWIVAADKVGESMIRMSIKNAEILQTTYATTKEYNELRASLWPEVKLTVTD
ncbi:hypothetical protein [Vibrio phage YC]|uniref:Uncharacterized protein n=1 Tax=Vibrio phage YC TaxID=2267403 RepID=A0A384ZS22_9CAUD|nr:hypothetical protein HWB64_gp068 [Vibrio phage YC]AXC34437.1 hypothetical protein [Vibrio phage YC]